MKWNKHIDNVIAKLSINKNLIGNSKNLMNIAAKHNIHYAHKYSHLTYANTDLE